MKKVLLILTLLVSLVSGSGITSQTRELINKQKKGEKIPPPAQKERIQTFSQVEEKKMPTMHGFLFLLQEVKEKKRIEEIPHMERLFKIHQKYTFSARYGENAEFVRAFDYNQFYCDELEKSLKMLRKIKAGVEREKQKK